MARTKTASNRLVTVGNAKRMLAVSLNPRCAAAPVKVASKAQGMDSRSMENHKGRLETAALIAEILGGVAVVVSVVYLALQISDNNRLLRSQSHFNAIEAAQRPFELKLSSDTLSTEMHQCDTQPFEVPDPIWERCSIYYFMQANGWEYTYLQHQDEAVPPSLWVGLDGYMGSQAMSNPGWVRFWQETAVGFGEPFRSYIDERVRKNPAYRGQ